MNAELSRACLGSERSVSARARHAVAIEAFNAAGQGHLLAGPVVPVAAIKATYLRLLMTKAPTVQEYDIAEIRASSFARFLQRERRRGVTP